MRGRKSYKRFSALGDPREAMPIPAELVAAIRNGDAQVVRKLLDDGADVNARDAEGNTPLILASFYGNPECVAPLLENGADVNAANQAGATPLIRAATDYEKARLLVAALLARQDGQPVPAVLLERLTRDVDKLRKQLERQAYDMPTTSQQEADARRFLGKLRSAVGQFPTTSAASAGPK